MDLHKIEYPTMQVTFKNKTFNVYPPPKYILGFPLGNIEKLKAICAELMSNNEQNYSFSADDLTDADTIEFIQGLYCFINEIHENPKFKVPYYPETEEIEVKYVNETYQERIVSDYSGIDFNKIEELNIADFWLLLRNAVIYFRSQTDEGKEYLDKCWCLEQTEPDRDTLRKMFGKEKS